MSLKNTTTQETVKHYEQNQYPKWCFDLYTIHRNPVVRNILNMAETMALSQQQQNLLAADMVPDGQRQMDPTKCTECFPRLSCKLSENLTVSASHHVVPALLAKGYGNLTTEYDLQGLVDRCPEGFVNFIARYSCGVRGAVGIHFSRGGKPEFYSKLMKGNLNGNSQPNDEFTDPNVEETGVSTQIPVSTEKPVSTEDSEKHVFWKSIAKAGMTRHLVLKTKVYQNNNFLYIAAELFIIKNLLILLIRKIDKGTKEKNLKNIPLNLIEKNVHFIIYFQSIISSFANISISICCFVYATKFSDFIFTRGFCILEFLGQDGRNFFTHKFFIGIKEVITSFRNSLYTVKVLPFLKSVNKVGFEELYFLSYSSFTYMVVSCLRPFFIILLDPLTFYAFYLTLTQSGRLLLIKFFTYCRLLLINFVKKLISKSDVTLDPKISN